MTKKRLLLKCMLGLMLLLLGQVAFSQARTITGLIKNEIGSPLQGATVRPKGQTTGVATDATGVFKITVNANVKSLIVSYVGYEEQEIALKADATLDISLRPSRSSLDEVVV